MSTYAVDAGIVLRAIQLMPNNGINSVVKFIPYCGKSNGANIRPCNSNPNAKPIAVGAKPNIKKSVEPKIKCTSETPTGGCGSTSKNDRTKPVVNIDLNIKLVLLSDCTNDAMDFAAIERDKNEVPILRIILALCTKLGSMCMDLLLYGFGKNNKFVGLLISALDNVFSKELSQFQLLSCSKCGCSQGAGLAAL